MNNTFKYEIYAVPIGWIGLISSTKGLTNCLIDSTYNNLETRMKRLINLEEVPQNLSESIKHSIESYFLGHPDSITEIPLDIPETSPPFFKKIWQACRTIPPGETQNYGWLAKQAGNPKAVRAAGQAMKKNKLPLFIPCHRVILSNNKLGNYSSGGTNMKKFFLNLESGGAYE